MSKSADDQTEDNDDDSDDENDDDTFVHEIYEGTKMTGQE